MCKCVCVCVSVLGGPSDVWPHGTGTGTINPAHLQSLAELHASHPSTVLVPGESCPLSTLCPEPTGTGGEGQGQHAGGPQAREVRGGQRAGGTPGREGAMRE